MTEKLYDLDSYINDFDAVVLSSQVTDKGGEIILDRTAFFPEGGGQSSDTGEISGFPVNDVRIRNDLIIHYVTLGSDEESERFCAAFRSGSAVHGSIDRHKRFERMQQHSGEHLLSGAVFRHFGYANTGFHLSDNGTTVDFGGTFSDEDLIMIEDEVNEIIFKNVPCRIYYPAAEELSSLNYRSKKELEGPIRIVMFGSNGEYDTCACCAPHVASTVEIGLFKILSAEHFKGGTRMSIACGQRLLPELRLLQENNRAISRILSVKPDQTALGVQKLNESYKDLKFNSVKIEKEMLDLTVKYAETPLLFLESAETGNVRNAVNTLAGSFKGYCACFIGNDEKGYNFIVSSLTDDCTVLLEKIRSELNASGGGSKGMIQGNLRSTKDRIEEYFLRNVVTADK